jgi:hypothetical protein
LAPENWHLEMGSLKCATWKLATWKLATWKLATWKIANPTGAIRGAPSYCSCSLLARLVMFEISDVLDQ